MYGRDFYKVTSELLLRRDYRNAHQRELKDISEQERSISVFILKKFDARHTMGEDDKLRLEDYKTFRARYARDQMSDAEARQYFVDVDRDN